MADYIRRDLAKKRFSKRLMWLKEDVHDEYSGALLDGCETDIELLDEIPAADVAEVVHCRDCKHKMRTIADGFVLCAEKHGMVKPTENDFCSYGEYQTNTGGSNNVAD